MTSRHGPECAAYYDHIFGCPSCSPAAGHHCPAGQSLRAAYLVPRWVESIMRTPTREARRQQLTQAVPADLRAEVEAQVRTRFAAGEVFPDADFHQRQFERRVDEARREKAARERRLNRNDNTPPKAGERTA